MRMTSFLRNSIIFLVVISFTILQSCVTDKSRNSNIPDWSEIEQKAKNNKITIAIESGITSYSGNFTNDLIDYFKSKYGIEIEIKLIQPNHLSNTECDIIYSTRSKISSLYKNNLLV